MGPIKQFIRIDDGTPAAHVRRVINEHSAMLEALWSAGGPAPDVSKLPPAQPSVSLAAEDSEPPEMDAKAQFDSALVSLKISITAKLCEALLRRAAIPELNDESGQRIATICAALAQQIIDQATKLGDSEATALE